MKKIFILCIAVFCIAVSCISFGIGIGFVIKKKEVIIKPVIIQSTKILREIWLADFYQTGVTSWYGNPEHGNITAWGKPFDMFAYTVAHQRLKFGTVISIKNLGNNKECFAMVTDRIPEKWVKRGRILDCSWAVANELNFIEKGLTKVEIRILRKVKFNELLETGVKK
jgi:rare lipoprotein A (peptidoglycan hydrolase)